MVSRYFKTVGNAEKMVLGGINPSDPIVRSAYRKANKIYKSMTKAEKVEVERIEMCMEIDGRMLANAF